jgi:hypothetical protein
LATGRYTFYGTLGTQAKFRQCGAGSTHRDAADAHDIIKLFDKCLAENLISLTDQMLVNALRSANEHYEYRYPDEPNRIRHAIPALPWTREAVGQLIAKVEPHIVAWTEAHPGELWRHQDQ